jgi:hypothetical protein
VPEGLSSTTQHLHWRLCTARTVHRSVEFGDHVMLPREPGSGTAAYANSWDDPPAMAHQFVGEVPGMAGAQKRYLRES